MSNDWLRNLYGHQEWADAEHWRALSEHPAAGDDEAIHNRLHHIHFVQHAFLWTVGDRKSPFAVTTAEDFASFDELRSYAGMCSLLGWHQTPPYLGHEIDHERDVIGTLPIFGPRGGHQRDDTLAAWGDIEVR